MLNFRNSLQTVSRLIVLTCALFASAFATQSALANSPSAQAPASTATQLPNGRFLIVGGDVNQKPSKQLSIYDPKTQQTTPLNANLSAARKNHSATLLPDGRVFIYGGVGADNITLGTAELYDPASGKLGTVAAPGLVARSHHSATLLTNGKLLIVGGLSNRGFPLSQAEQWNPRTGQAIPLSRGSSLERSAAAARLLPDGNVLYQGGVDRNQNPVANNLLFKAESERFEEISLAESANLIQIVDAPKALVVTTTIPPTDINDFIPDGLITLRFSQPIDVTTANVNSVVLIGPNGAVAAKVTSSQDGMLVFLTPNVELLPATRYTLIAKDIQDQTGQVLEFDARGFNTASLLPTSSVADGNFNSGKFALPGINESIENAKANQASNTVNSSAISTASSVTAESLNIADTDDDEAFTPKPTHQGGRWRIGKELPEVIHSRMDYDPSIRDRINAMRKRAEIKGKKLASVPNLNERTGVAGVVLRLNDKPLENVTISVAGRSTRTGGDGRFELLDVPAGKYEIMVDGSTVGIPGREFASFVFSVEIQNGRLTELPHAMYLPRIRAKDWVNISSPTESAVVATHPDIPGLEIRIPKGTVLRDRQGKNLTKFAIVPVPLDRSPFPTPANFPVYFMIHPGGATIQGLEARNSPGVQIVYPNYTNDAPGTEHHFWLYDSRVRGWFVYGKAHVSADGKQIVPDPDVGLHESMVGGHSIGTGAPPPNPAPPPGGCGGQAGDPVDCATGLFLHSRTDVVLTDVLPINITRTYRPGDTVRRSFGFGTAHNYGIYLSNPVPGTYDRIQVILPDGGRIDFPRTGGTSLHTDYVWTHTATPTQFYGAKIKSPYDARGERWELTLRDGTLYTFDPYSGLLTNIRDRFGNEILFINSGGQVQRMVTSNGRYVDFTYDVSNRITQIKDFEARVWTYAYNGTDYLASVTYPDGSFEGYTYDASGRMLTVTDRRGKTMVTNQYDVNGRVVAQTLADGGNFLFAYTVNASSKVTQTDVTDPRGNVERKVFSDNGYITSRTFALGKPEQQIVTTERQAGTNLVLSETDALGRKTSYTYDINGNTTSVTRLAGTANAITESYTYDTAYSQVTSRTDALGKTTTFTYNTLGSLTQVTDPLGNRTKLTYNAAGQPLSVTDALNNVATFSYDLGDLMSVTDPLGRTSQRFIDSLGRLAVATDALGNRTNYGYDVLDRVTQITDAIAQLTQFSYDPLSNLLTLTDARGNVTQHVYDAKNRLITRTDPALKNESYQYDGNDNTIQYTDRKLQVTGQTYDALDRGITTTYADSSTTTNTFDAGNRLTQATDSLSGSITRSYDGLNRLISETSPKGTISYTYDANSRRTSMSVAGQPTVTYSYDNADRITQISQGTTSVSYSYDAANRRTSMTLPNGIVASYSYDAASQLTSIVYAKPNATLIGDLIYSYDLLGRRTGVTGSLARTGLPGAVASANYDGNNRLTNWGGANITYDANGNMLTDGSRTYTWDARDRLVAISGSATASFQYDAFNRRLNKTVNGTATGYLYDRLNPVQELTGATPKANTLTGLGIDEFYRRTDANGSRDLITDALGSVIALADSLAQIKTEYTYAAYGQTTATGEANENSFQYTGRENDGTGLYYYRARYFNPELSRFISEDPIGFGGGINQHAYTGGNPISFTDPLGLVNPGTAVGAGIGTFVFPGVGTVVGAGVGTAIGVGIAWWAFSEPTLAVPPENARDPNGPKAPGKPGEEDGFEDPKGGENWVPNPNPGRGGSSHGWQDKKGNVWCPTGQRPGRAHGGPGWDVQTPGGGYENIFPKKK